MIMCFSKVQHSFFGLVTTLLTFGSFSLRGQETALGDSLWNHLEEVVVTAQYAPTEVKNALYQVKVISAREIRQQGQNNLNEVLTNQLNLRVSSDPVLGNGLAIQGLGGENVQILMDGVPVIGRLNGNIDLSQINLYNVERIEIIEGAMSAQYGSNAAGGVINLITKRSQVDRFRLESQNQFESAGILNNSLAVGFQSKEVFLSLQGSRIHQQFGPEDSLRLMQTVPLETGGTVRQKKIPWNPKTQYNLDGTFRYLFSDSFNLTYQYRYFHEQVDRLGEIRRPAFLPYALDDRFITIRQDHSLNLEAYPSRHLYLNSTTAYNQFHRRSATSRWDLENDSVSLVPGAQDTSRFTSLLHRSVLSSLLGGKLNGQFGLEILQESGSGDRIIDSTSHPIDRTGQTNYAAWLGLKYQPFETLLLSGNLRAGYNTQFRHPLVPSLHARWEPMAQLTVTASYAHGFRSPSLKEQYMEFIDVNHFIVGNPDLKPEYSRNASFELEYRPGLRGGRQLSLQGRVFYNYIQDRIVLAQFAQLQFNYQNLEEFQTHGLNLQFRFRQGRDFRLKSGFAYTWVFNPLSREFDARRFTAVPEAQSELGYRIPGIETELVLVHRFVGRQLSFLENDQGELGQGTIGSMNLINLSLTRSFWADRIFFSAGVKNILDVQELPISGQVSGGGAHGNAGDSQLLGWGRTVFVRLNLNLGFDPL